VPDRDYEQSLAKQMAALLSVDEAVPPLAANRGAAVEALFRLWDIDGSGALDFEELIAAFGEESDDWSDEDGNVQALESLALLDVDADETISLPEMLLFFARSDLNTGDDDLFFSSLDVSLSRAYLSYERQFVGVEKPDSEARTRYDRIAGHAVRADLNARLKDF